jgi:hypothetical protein
VIVAFELVVLFVFNSHAEEKYVRKDDERVHEKEWYKGRER